MSERQRIDQTPVSRGVRCPACGCRHAPVKFTRHAGALTIRERECRACKRRFKTQERIT